MVHLYGNMNLKMSSNSSTRVKQQECDKLYDDLQAAYYETNDSLQAAQHDLGNVPQEVVCIPKVLANVIC